LKTKASKQKPQTKSKTILPKTLSKHEIENDPSLLFHTHHFIFHKKIKDLNINPIHQIGDSIDELEDVEIFYNGSIRHIENRNVTKDGYNLGLRWQCVEFVKRFYLKFFNHKMPDSYGHAKDFFDKNIEDGKLNKARNLIQHSNPSLAKECELNRFRIFAASLSLFFTLKSINYPDKLMLSKQKLRTK
jgi:hypothetical protein